MAERPASGEIHGVASQIAEVWGRRALRALLARKRIRADELVSLVAPWVATSLELTMGDCLRCDPRGVGELAEAIVGSWIDELCSSEGQLRDVEIAGEHAQGRAAVAVLERLVGRGEVSVAHLGDLVDVAVDELAVLPEDAALLVDSLGGRFGRVA